MILDPLHDEGYQFWSGIGSGSPVFVALLVFWRHHNCHVHRCPRLSWHPHPEHGHPCCRRHHPENRAYRRRHGGK